MISHPHFYTTHISWAATFDCQVYVHSLDREWLCRTPLPTTKRVLLQKQYEEIVEGVTAIQVGGHFEGSMVLHWDGHLFIADTFVNVPVSTPICFSMARAGISESERKRADHNTFECSRVSTAKTDRKAPLLSPLCGKISVSCFWFTPALRFSTPLSIVKLIEFWNRSIPNMIPLPPDTIHNMWKAVKPYDFTATHGLFTGWDIRDENVKKSVLESMKIQVRNQGFAQHALLDEE